MLQTGVFQQTQALSLIDLSMSVIAPVLNGWFPVAVMGSECRSVQEKEEFFVIGLRLQATRGLDKKAV
jgi:hypothetical protein